MPLKRRLINVKFTLGEGAFGESGSREVEVSGLRVSARILKAGGAAMSTAQVQIFGLTLSKVNDLTTLGMAVIRTRRNVITLTAGEEGGAMGTVFIGQIIQAWADFRAQPQVPFIVQAQNGALEAVKTAQPVNYPQGTPASTILSSLASQMGLRFENSGVTAVLPPMYLWGAPREQAKQVVDAAGIEWNGGDNGVLAVWPRNGSRGGAVPLVSRETGMDGYPTYTANGIAISTLFNPEFGLGGQIEVRSTLKEASGRWTIFSLDHELESMLPRGRWHSQIQAARPGLVVLPGARGP